MLEICYYKGMKNKIVKNKNKQVDDKKVNLEQQKKERVLSDRFMTTSMDGIIVR